MLHCHPEFLTVMLSEAKDLQTIQPSPPDRAFCFSPTFPHSTHTRNKSISSEAKCFVRALGSSSDKTLCLAAAGLNIRQLRCMHSPQCTPHHKPKPSPNSNTIDQTPSTKTSWSPTPWPNTMAQNTMVQNTMAQNTMIPNTMDPIPWPNTMVSNTMAQNHGPKHNGPPTPWTPTQWTQYHGPKHNGPLPPQRPKLCSIGCHPYLKCLYLCSKGGKFCSKGLKFYPSNIQ